MIVLGLTNLGPAAPTVLTQPQSQAVIAGSEVTFSAVVSGITPLSYQWQFNGANLPAATNAALTLNSVTTNQAGGYSVSVTNTAGSTNSTVAVLSVYASAAATLSVPAYLTNGGLVISLTGVPGYSYIVQTSTNLVQWISLRTNKSPFDFEDPNARFFPGHFYRGLYLSTP